MRIILSCLIAATTIGLSPVVAAAQTRPAPRERNATKSDTPPRYWIKTALKIGACEQPSGRSGTWGAVNWTNTKNYSFLGGLGLTNLNWTTFKRNGQPATMNKATPMEQIWASWRLYQWANKTYPGNGWTAWDCSNTIGFHGFNRSHEWE